jgi:hypothetical protein
MNSLISYVPLLYSQWDVLPTPVASRWIQAAVMSATVRGLGMARATLWVTNHDQTASPVLILDHAKHIHEHLRFWGSGYDRGSHRLHPQPQKYFSLVIHREKDWYGLTLWPDFQRSRSRLNYMSSQPGTQQVSIISLPIRMWSPSLTGLDLADPHLPADHASIGFLDISDFNPQDPQATPHDKVHWIEKIPRKQSPEAIAFLKELRYDSLALVAPAETREEWRPLMLEKQELTHESTL